MSSIETDYRALTPASAAMQARAERTMSGGDTRSSANHAPYPVTFVRGEGPRLFDIDGNTYLDLNGNYTTHVHGNAYAPIVEAVQLATRQGSAWAARNTHQLELAELLVDRVDAVEQVRFANSGTEAAMLAIHLAKAATGRPKILVARHGYHGSHEDTQAGTYATTSKLPLYGGPTGETDATLVADFGDADQFEAILSERDGEVAAVLLEPVAGSLGLLEATTSFLTRVQKAAGDAGAIFILDEVVTFRLDSGGAAAIHPGLVPDLTMFGKVIGGGFPVGAVGGPSDLLALAAPGGPLSHSGTFNGNPVTCAAGGVSVHELTAGRIQRMHDQALRLEELLRAGAERVGLPLSVRRVGSLLQVFVQDTEPTGLLRTASKKVTALHLAAMVEGVHFTPRGMLALSTVFTDNDIDEAADRLTAAMGRVVDA